jgi:phospholipid/cholesterol/gamma-HCH transport system permease protein
LIGVVERVGRNFTRGIGNTGFALLVLARAAAHVPRMFLSRRGFQATLEQMYYCGVKALSVTSVVALFTGMIVALQVGIELKKYGQAQTVGLLVAISMCREMGPMITAIIVTAMVGSTIAAEIGTMKVSEEIDALEVMSIDPVRMLVVPRLIALTLMTMALTILVDFLGIMGGGLVAVARLQVSFYGYLDWARRVLDDQSFLGLLPKDVYTGLTKSIVFGALIATVACSQGLRARGGALGVGRAVRKTVVVSIMLTLVLGYLMTAFFYATE